MEVLQAPLPSHPPSPHHLPPSPSALRTASPLPPFGSEDSFRRSFPRGPPTHEPGVDGGYDLDDVPVVEEDGENGGEGQDMHEGGEEGRRPSPQQLEDEEDDE